MLYYKNLLLILFIIVPVFSISAQTPGYQWARNVSTYSVAKGSCTDVNGNVFSTGFYTGTATFGSTTYTSSGYDVFLVKYDSMGTVLWAKRGIGVGSGENYATSVTTDNAGNVYITGRFNSPTLTFGSIVLNNVEGSGTTNADFFIAKFSASGNVLWAKSAGGFSSGAPFSDMGWSICSDNLGNVIVSGFFSSPTLSFGWNTLYNSTIAGGNADLFFVKYNSAGTDVWAKSYGGSAGSEHAWAVETDPNNNILVTGSFTSDTLVIGLDTLINTGFGHNIFVSKFSPSGNPTWSKAASGVMDGHGKGITSDASGNVIATGHFNGPSLIWENDTLVNSGFDDIFLVKYDSTGTILWAKSQNGNRADLALDVITDSIGNILLTGAFDGTFLIFGPDTLLNSAIWYPDIFIAKLDPSGNELWAKSVGGTTSTSYSDDDGNSIALDSKGNIYCVGYFTGPDITFPPYTLINGSGGYANAFIVRLGKITAGTAELSIRDEDILLYPNPNKGEFHIRISTPLSTIEKLEIRNAMGSIIYSEVIDEPEAHIFIPGFASGVYFIQLYSKGKNYRKRIIIQ